MHVPYLPSYLAFRELPLILEAVKLLGVIPDLYMFDEMDIYIRAIWG
ncbi:MAG: endonuclease V [Streptococcus sp.]